MAISYLGYIGFRIHQAKAKRPGDISGLGYIRPGQIGQRTYRAGDLSSWGYIRLGMYLAGNTLGWGHIGQNWENIALRTHR